MPASIQHTLALAVLNLLRPLVKILLRNGIAYGSFAELAKKVYVDVAWEEFAPAGRKPSLSGVAALTGLTRKEARRLHGLAHTDEASSARRYNRAVRVISGWVNDAEFLDSQHRPAELPLDGASGSFASLVRKYSGDVTTHAMLGVLSQAGSVEQAGERLRLVRHAWLPGNDDADRLGILGRDTAELIATIDHNLVCAPEARRFQRKVSNHRLRAASVAEFQSLSARESQRLLEELDAWLARHEAGDGEPARYVSVGIWFHEHSNDKEQEDRP